MTENRLTMREGEEIKENVNGGDVRTAIAPQTWNDIVPSPAVLVYYIRLSLLKTNLRFKIMYERHLATDANHSKVILAPNVFRILKDDPILIFLLAKFPAVVLYLNCVRKRGQLELSFEWNDWPAA